MTHDATHCSDYRKGECPESCYRARLTEDYYKRREERRMNDIVRFVGSAVIALILVSFPGLLVASFAFEWDGLLKTLFCWATVSEVWVTMCLLYDRSEERVT